VPYLIPHIILGFYLMATLLYLLRTIYDRPALTALGLRLVFGAALAQTCFLIWHFVKIRGAWPHGYFEFFQLTSLLLAYAFIGLCFIKRFYRSGVLFLVTIVLFNALSYVQHTWASNHLEGLSLFTQQAHIAVSFLCLLFYSLAAIITILFLSSERQIKHKQISSLLAKLPALTTLETLQHKTMSLGFVFLTLVIVSGTLFSKLQTGHYFDWHQGKQHGSLFCWFYFALLFCVKSSKKMHGHRSIVYSLFGLILLVLLFFIGFI